MPKRPDPAPPRRRVPACALGLVLIGFFGAPLRAQVFEPPIPVVELNTERQEKSPCISDDGLELYFQSDRVEGLGVIYWTYVARRSETAAPFGPPERIVMDAANPDVSSDGLTLYVARDSLPGDALDIDLYRLRRPSREAPFGVPEAMVELNSAYKDGSSSITADERTIVFHSDRPGSVGETDLWMATRASRDVPFDPPSPVPGINTAHQELTPSITPDGKTLYFASTRPGGLGSNDIWVTTRATTSEPFGEPVNVAAVNSPGTEKACDISSDGLTLYLRTKSVDGEGVSEIAVAHDVRSGSVHRGVGDPVDVLFVNDSPGDARRVVRVAVNAPIAVRLDASPAGPLAPRYVLYAFPLDRHPATIALQPHSIGATAFATPLDGGRPSAIVLGNRFLGPAGARFGTPKLALPAAPGILIDQPAGYPTATHVLLQAFLEDAGSPAPVPLAITNAVELIVQ